MTLYEGTGHVDEITVCFVRVKAERCKKRSRKHRCCRIRETFDLICRLVYNDVSLDDEQTDG